MSDDLSYLIAFMEVLRAIAAAIFLTVALWLAYVGFRLWRGPKP